MQAEFSKLVEAAKAIKTSGRWAAVNENIRELCANPGLDPQLVGSTVCISLCSAFRGISGADASVLRRKQRNLIGRMAGEKSTRAVYMVSVLLNEPRQCTPSV